MNARVATVGFNPSNLEFVSLRGDELTGEARRLPTLSSLGIASWGEAGEAHLQEIKGACDGYFSVNPYGWFNPLEEVAQATRASFFGGGSAHACHLDLVPFATWAKWSALAPLHKDTLLGAGGAALAGLLQDSPIRTVVLNGAGVVDLFCRRFDVTIESCEMPDWKLPHARGRAYWGMTDSLGSLRLGRSVQVLGFNFNLQGTHGASAVKGRICRWLRDQAGAALVPGAGLEPARALRPSGF
jgi:hypothetical protein